MDASIALHACDGCELRFQSLSDPARVVIFPCDAAGCVDLDALSESARADYFYARTVIGRKFATPAVARTAMH